MPPAVDVSPWSIEVSVTVPPTVIVGAERLVVIVTPTGLMVRGSQPLVTPMLLVSPE